MKILEEFTIQDKKYICMQKLSIDSRMIYICKDLATNQNIYFREDIDGELEEVSDEDIKNKIHKLIYAESEDVVY